MTYIAGEEMTHYACNLMLDKWIRPFVDTEQWEMFDCSCKNRDNTNDAVLHDAVESGARLGAIFKEPTVTPTGEQVQEYGLSQQLPSPNGAMRRGWNGISATNVFEKR
jgi:isocitrate dehydrogenase